MSETAEQGDAAAPGPAHPPYIVEYTVEPGFALPPGFSIERFPGLNACQVYVNFSKHTAQLILHWRSKDFFEAQQGERLHKELKVPAAHWEGSERQAQVKKGAWWRPKSMWTVIVHAMAFFGTLEAMEKYWDSFMGVPQISIAISKDKHPRYLKGKPLNVYSGGLVDVSLELRNVGNAGKCSFHVRSAQVLDDKGTALSEIPLTVSDPIAPNLDVGKSESLVIRGTPPVPGEYRIQVEGFTKLGKFRGEVPFREEFPIRVWDGVMLERGVSLKIMPDRKQCSLRYILKTGAPYARLQCKAVLGEHPELRFGGIAFPGVESSEKGFAPTPGKEVATLYWEPTSLEAFGEYSFTIFLESKKEYSDSEWKIIADLIELNAVP